MIGGGRERPRQDLVGLDFGASGLKAVRLTRSRDRIVVRAADIFPPVPLRANGEQKRLELPPPLLSNYAAVCIGGARSAVRLLELPTGGGVSVEDQIQQQFNLSGDYRLGHFPVTPPGLKGTLRTVAVAVPEDEAQAVLQRMAVGAPAPYSLEMASLAALNALDFAVGAAAREEAIGLIETGVSACHVFILHQGRPVLIRRIEPGGAAVVERIGQQFELDENMSVNVLRTGAIDLSILYRETLAPFFKQLAISREFIERRERCSVRRWYLTGGLCVNPFWARTVTEVTGLPATVWNPFDGLTLAADALPARLRGEECRFAAAVGAALGGLQPS